MKTQLDTEKIVPALKGVFLHGVFNWKSSVSGLCGLAISLILAYTVLPPKAGEATVAIALLRAAVLWLQTEAGTTLAVVPGSSEPQAVPSHEVPDDPNAEAVQP